MDGDESQKRRAVQKLKSVLGSLRDKRVALLGLTFKPGTDDMREAASIVLASRLLSEGAQVTCWDPMAPALTGHPWSETERFGDVMEALYGADAAILTTEWPQLVNLDWSVAGARMKTPVVLDGRSVLDPMAATRAGLTYLGIGRGAPLTEDGPASGVDAPSSSSSSPGKGARCPLPRRSRTMKKPPSTKRKRMRGTNTAYAIPERTRPRGQRHDQRQL